MQKEFQLISSVYKKTDTGDVVIANMKDVHTNVSEMVTFENPQRPIYVTKKGLRSTFTDRKEFSMKHDLEEYIVPNHEMQSEIKKKLGLKPWARQKEVLDNPYVWAADVPIEVIIKQAYSSRASKPATEFKVGALDIETSVSGGKEIILNTYTHSDGQCFTAIFAPWLKDGETLDLITKTTNDALDQFRDNLNKRGREMYDKLTAQHADNRLPLNFKIFTKEVDLVDWIMQQIHRLRPDFISIWNMGFDIQYMLDRLSVHGVSHASVMCHPEVKHAHRVSKWIHDKSKSAAHFTRLWHWYDLTGPSQFIDTQALYSRLRTVEGMEASYALNYIATKLLGIGKLNFGVDGHAKMQRDRFVEYIAYNIVDTLLLVIMDMVTDDISSMVFLTKDTNTAYYAKATVQLRDSFYSYCKQHDRVPGSISGNQAKPYDHMITNIGGGVLDPSLARGTGIPRLEESDEDTYFHMMVADLDVTSEYPYLQLTCNISKETKLGTVLTVDGLNGVGINDYFGHITSTMENAAYICSKFYGLPDYNGMLDCYDEFIRTTT